MIFFQSLVCFARVALACWEGAGLHSVPPCVCESFVYSKRNQNIKTGRKLEVSCGATLKQMLGRAQQLCNAQGVFL